MFAKFIQKRFANSNISVGAFFCAHAYEVKLEQMKLKTLANFAPLGGFACCTECSVSNCQICHCSIHIYIWKYLCVKSNLKHIGVEFLFHRYKKVLHGT